MEIKNLREAVNDRIFDGINGILTGGTRGRMKGDFLDRINKINRIIGRILTGET
jgi:hypothetical protein